MTVEEKLMKLVAEKLGKTGEEVGLDSRFQEDLGADSLDLVELIMELEDEFDVEVPDESAEHMKTVQDALDYILKNKND